MFSEQESRRFVCSLAVYGQPRFIRLTVIDREGILYQEIPTNGRHDNAHNLFRIVASFMCGNVAGLGYDPMVKLKPDGIVDTITVVYPPTEPVPRISRCEDTACRHWNHWAVYPCLAGSAP